MMEGVARNFVRKEMQFTAPRKAFLRNYGLKFVATNQEWKQEINNQMVQ